MPARADEVAGWHEPRPARCCASTTWSTPSSTPCARIGSSRSSSSRFDVGGVIDEVLTRLAPLLRRHRLERYATRQPHALGDPARLAQVLELLLENAAKYAPPGAEIVVADWSADGEVHVAVGDDGPGVPPEMRESVFEPFVRLTPGPISPGPASASSPPAGWWRPWAAGSGSRTSRPVAASS